MWKQDIGTFPVRLEEQGDEWVHHLGLALIGRPDLTLFTEGEIEIAPAPYGPVTSRLVVGLCEDGIACTVVGDGEATPGQVKPWQDAARVATAALGKSDRVIMWEAIIGTTPYALPDDRVLGGILSLGPVLLTPGGVRMREYVTRHEYVADGRLGVRHSFPLIASGTVHSYDWYAARPLAERELHLTCALLSLVTARLWKRRGTPRARTGDREPLRVPACAGPTWTVPHLDGEGPWTEEIPPGTKSFDLPPWLDHARQALDADPGLTTAILAHYEAMNLHDCHPSVAHLAYVAAIEGFGARFAAPTRCDCCARCTREKGFATKRFQKALKTAMTQREVRHLAAIAYHFRSRTGHEGSLFGTETTFGYEDWRWFSIPDEVLFNATFLDEICKASRQVLTKALRTASEQWSDRPAAPNAPA
ncbi:hypothetical protein ACIRYZ_14585 [Kitasatospora sp. NPDC101155]|uniref:hypothetical protein n=1 Tax=Kitasatospora sp. NPDC101155 TaxID=3364097 RepID=UPI00381E6435